MDILSAMTLRRNRGEPFDILVEDVRTFVKNKKVKVEGIKGRVTFIHTRNQEMDTVWKAVHDGNDYLVKVLGTRRLAMSHISVISSTWKFQKVPIGKMELSAIVLVSEKVPRNLKERKREKLNRQSMTRTDDQEQGVSRHLNISKARAATKQAETEREEVNYSHEQQEESKQDENMKMFVKKSKRKNKRTRGKHKNRNQARIIGIHQADNSSAMENTRVGEINYETSNHLKMTEKIGKLNKYVLNKTGWDEESNEVQSFMRSVVEHPAVKHEATLMCWIFETFDNHLKFPWGKVSDLESLKKVLEDYFREKVLEQSRLNKNMVLTQRFEEFFSRSNSFYFLLTCFALHCVHHLDTGQVCEILDFCLGYEEEFYAEIVDALRRNEDNWFSTMKKTWLKKVHEVESSYLPILARQSWSVEVYDFFIKKYRNEFEEERLSFLKNKEFRSLCQTEVLKLAISSPTLAEYPENYERFSFHRHVYALLHHLRMTSQYDTLIMVIDKILKAQENVGNIPGVQDKVGAICKRAMSTVKGKRNIGPIKANFLIALICQILIYNIDTNSLSWLSRANQPSNKRIFRENILNKVFSPELHENKFIEDIIKEICGEDRSQSSILESQYHVFMFLWAEYKNFSNLVVKETVLTCLNADEVVQPYLKECGCLEEKERTRFYHLLIVFQAMGYQHKGFSLRKVQVLTVLYLAFYPQQHSNKKGVLARMFTGEGKTVVVALLAAYLALEGKRVDVLTSSSELARDQVEELIPFYKFLGISVDGLEYEKEEDYKSVSELEGEEEEISTATVQVLYGTAPSYIRELLSDQNLLEKRRERFERKPDVAIVDEVDNMLFDRSNALIQLSSIETATLMPLLYPILIEIYFQVKESYPNYKPPKDTNGEEQGQIVNYLLREFKESNEPDSPAKRLKELLETKRRRIRELFPPLERVDGDDFTYIGSFYDYSCLLSISKLPLSVTKDSLTTYIYSQLARVDSEAVCKRIMFTNYSSEKVDAWVLLDKEDAVHHLVDRGAEKFEDCEISFARCHDSGNKSVSKIFSSPMRMQTDIGQAKALAKLFDSESNIQGGLESFQKKFCRSEPELDFVVGYLWRVHFFCYYSQNQFESLGDLVSRSLSPTIRLIPRKNKQSKEEGNTLIDFDKNIKRMLNSVECRELREEYQDIERLHLKTKFFGLFQTLPRLIRRHALFQFEAWVENCYLSIMRVTKDVAYVSNQEQGRNIKIDAANTGVLQENTHLSDGLQQFLSMKEDRYIVPPSLTSNFMSLVGFYKKYGAIYGLTGTLGNQDTIDFLVEEYQVDCVNIPSNFMPRVESPISHTTTPYRCFEFPPLVMKKRENWLLVIAESVKQQLTLGRPVLVFCSSLLSLEQYIKPKLEKMNDSLTKSVPIKRYDAISEMKDKEIEEKMIILATNIAGRGTDLKVRRELKDTGGLHICLTFLPESERVELQCVGRTARNGEMGSAQLILLDREGRDIKTLKENRKEMNVSKIERMKQYIVELAAIERYSETFRNKFDPYLNTFSFFEEEQEELATCRENWLQFVQSSKAKFKRYKGKSPDEQDLHSQKNKFAKLSDLDKKPRVKKAFLNKTRRILGSNQESLDRMKLSYLQQEWCIWMKRNCFRNGRVEMAPSLEAVANEKVNQLVEIMESKEVSVQHHIFTASEAFRLLFETKLTAVDTWKQKLEILFRESGVMKINTDWNELAVYRNRDYPALALYYLAVYKLRCALVDKDLQEHKYVHAIHALEASKQAIDTQIIAKFRMMREPLIPTSNFATHLKYVYMAFKQLVDSIELMIEMLGNLVDKASVAYELHREKIEDTGRGYNDNLDEYLLANVVEHCKAFGYYGKFSLSELRPGDDKTDEPTERVRLFKSSYVKHFVSSLYDMFKQSTHYISFSRFRNAETETEASEQRELIILKVDASTNIMCSLDNFSYTDFDDSLGRLDFYLSHIGQSHNLKTELGRALFIYGRTKRGIQKHGLQNSDDVMKDLFFKEGGQILDHAQLKKMNEMFENNQRKIQDFENSFEHKVKQRQNLFLGILSTLWYKAEIEKYIPAFQLDVMNGNYRYENRLMAEFKERDMKDFNDKVNNMVKAFSEQDGNAKEIALDYVEMIYDDIFISSLEEVEGIFAAEDKFVDDGIQLEEHAKLRYKDFVGSIIQPFLDSLRRKTEREFDEKKNLVEEEVHETEQALVKAAREASTKVVKKSPKKFTFCFCCDESAHISFRLQQLASAFQIVIVFINVPTRTQIFMIDNPVTAVRVFFQNGQWIVNNIKMDCLLDLLTRFYTLLPEKHELLVPGGIPAEEAIPGEDSMKVAWYNYEGAEQECLNGRFIDASTSIMDRHKLNRLIAYHHIK